VLDRQSPTVREFLLQTAVLQRLSGSLCDAVTGRTDSQALLEAIERSGLFLVPLDDVRGWWRYHQLFAELLRVRLQQHPGELVRELHRRAAAWYEAHGLADEVVGHALRADDPALAARVIERHADELLLRSEGVSLQRSLAELPEGAVSSRRLVLAGARAALYGGRVVEAEQLLATTDRFSSDDAGVPFEPSVDRAVSPLADPNPMTALLHAFVAHLRGDADTAGALASRALDEIDDGRGSALVLIARWHLATADWLRGSVRDAEPALAANIAGWRAAHEHDRAAWAAHYLGQIQQARGSLSAAVETYDQVLAHDAAQTGPDAPVAGIAHIGLAQVAYRRNDLDEARHHADEGITRCRRFVYTQALATGLATLARILQAAGDVTGARDAIAEAVEAGPSADVVDLLNPVPAERARLLLVRGEVDEAAAWVVERGIDAHDEPDHAREPAHLVLARVLVAQGRPADALRVLERLRAAAIADGRLGSRVEIDVLRALAMAAMDDTAGAVDALARAVSFAAPERHVRVFVDEGEAMAQLLGELVAAPATGPMDAGEAPLAYVGLLARSFDDGVAGGPAVSTSTRRGLVVPLTERELEVLRLVATGKQNKEIAAELSVTLNTVKKHVTHIFDKLGATNRTAATDRARELGLLP
jgi:LuxR family maltose regulon positive regulatory protein